MNKVQKELLSKKRSILREATPNSGSKTSFQKEAQEKIKELDSEQKEKIKGYRNFIREIKDTTIETGWKNVICSVVSSLIEKVKGKHSENVESLNLVTSEKITSDPNNLEKSEAKALKVHAKTVKKIQKQSEELQKHYVNELDPRGVNISEYSTRLGIKIDKYVKDGYLPETLVSGPNDFQKIAENLSKTGHVVAKKM